MSNRDLNFTPPEMARLRECCRALGTSYAEFVRFATLQALDECAGYARDAQAVREFYEGTSARREAERAAEGFLAGAGGQ